VASVAGAGAAGFVSVAALSVGFVASGATAASAGLSATGLADFLDLNSDLSLAFNSAIAFGAIESDC